MTILARIVRFLLWLLVLSLSVRALRRLFGLLLENRGSSPQHAAKGSASPPPTKTGRRLVRDPVCGMYVDETLSIPMREDGDRKSTRLNSSHGYISYAVFCLKKKKTAYHMRSRYQDTSGAHAPAHPGISSVEYVASRSILATDKQLDSMDADARSQSRTGPVSLPLHCPL